MRYLLDTNVLVEVGRPGGSPKVKRWFGRLLPIEVYLSPVAVAEYLTGALRFSSKADRHNAAGFLRQVLRTFPYLMIDHRAAARWAVLRAKVRRAAGHHDLWLAALALNHRLTLATRNVRDFTPLGVRVHNPF